MSDTRSDPEPAAGPEPSPDEKAELERIRAEEADEKAEVERLRAEVAALRSQESGQPRRRHFSWRTPVSIVLIVLGCILSAVSVIGVWAGNSSDTGRWVATVKPLIHDPAVQNVLTDKITDQISSRIDITGTINQAAAQLNSRGLPKISSLLTTFSPQIASSVTGFIHSTVHSVISSQAMANAWVQVNTVAHQALVKVLSGQGGCHQHWPTARSFSTLVP